MLTKGETSTWVKEDTLRGLICTPAIYGPLLHTGMVYINLSHPSERTAH